jgi:putative ABC transport system permease protein
MYFAFRNALREIRNNRSFCIFYIANLAIGLVGFLTVDSFKRSLEEKVIFESKTLLGADIAIRARRSLSDEESLKIQKILPPETKNVSVVDFYSMIAGPTGRSRLVKVVAMEPGFPFYGEFELGNPEKHIHSNNSLHEGMNIWIYPELKSQLGIKVGDAIKLGDAKLVVSDLVVKDSGLQFQPAELAPKVFISQKNLAQTNLLKKGNTAFHNSLYKLSPNQEIDKLVNSLGKTLSTPDIQVYSHQKAGHRAGRLLGYLSDFLSLVSLVALFLACLGSGYLFNGFIINKSGDIAILMCLGSSQRNATLTYIIQLMVLGLIACIPALGTVMLVLPIASETLEGLMPSALNISLTHQTVLLSFIVSLLAGWLLAIPSLKKIKNLNPANLLRESAKPGSFQGTKWILSITPAIVGFWILTVTQSNSWKLGNLFFFGFLTSTIILFVIGKFCLQSIEKFFNRTNLPLKLAVRSLCRNRSHTLTGFMALGLGVLLLNLIPQFQTSLESEIGLKNKSGKLPKLFLFDVQENQVTPLKNLLEFEGHPLSNITPWVRGKLLKVKDQKYKVENVSSSGMNDPENERRNRFRNRSFNLSYRDHLLDSEEIIKGRMVSLTYNPDDGKPAEVSIEQKYAESMNLDINDKIEIEVSGVEIPAIVVNIRRVRWTSFQPNFFVQMQPGVLEQAPKTFIATLNNLDINEKESVQNLLVEKFPTISILDVERTGEKILSIVEQMTWVLQLMAMLSILAGLVILYSISKEKAREQRWEINLLKILGASFKDLKNQVRIEFALLGFCSSLVGVLLSSLFSFILAEYIFDKVWAFNLILPLLIISVVVALSVITAEWGTRKLLNEKPGSILHELH